MRQKLFLLLMLLATMPALAQKAGLTGVVVDANTGAPVSGASVMLNEQGAFVTTGPSGDFIISDLAAGKEIMTIVAFGYNDLVKEIELFNNQTIDLGKISFVPADANVINENQELLIDQTMLEEDEESNQTIGALMGASDNVYFSTAAYDFGPMYFRVPETKMTLAAFMRAQLSSSVAVMKIGVDLLREKEGIEPGTLTAHGGLFKVKGVAQQMLADALDTPVSVMETAGEGGAWGMALLAAFMKEDGGELGKWLTSRVFGKMKSSTLEPEKSGVDGFNKYSEHYK